MTDQQIKEIMALVDELTFKCLPPVTEPRVKAAREHRAAIESALRAAVPESLATAVFTVLEGYTLHHDARKILETAYYSESPRQAPQAAQPVQPLTPPQRRGLIDAAGNKTDGLGQDDFAQEIVSSVERHYGISAGPSAQPVQPTTEAAFLHSQIALALEEMSCANFNSAAERLRHITEVAQQAGAVLKPEPVALDDPPKDELAQALFIAWAKAEPKHSITQHPVSYWATFIDMARAARAFQQSEQVRKPLSDAEIFDLAGDFGAFEFGDAQGDKRLAYARAIERAHHIKES